MARIKKNTAAQILFTMVDNSSFTGIKSGLAMNSLTATLYGVKHGGSTAAKVTTPSKAASIVRSGLYRWPLKSTEVSDVDMLTVYITAAASQSAADQILQYEVEDWTTADISAQLSNLDSNVSAQLSNLQSYLVAISGVLSDTQSYLVTISGELSNIYSQVVGASDVLSKLGSASNIASVVWAAPYSNYTTASTMGGGMEKDRLILRALKQILEMQADIFSKLNRDNDWAIRKVDQADELISEIENTINPTIKK